MAEMLISTFSLIETANHAPKARYNWLAIYPPIIVRHTEHVLGI